MNKLYIIYEENATAYQLHKTNVYAVFRLFVPFIPPPFINTPRIFQNCVLSYELVFKEQMLGLQGKFLWKEVPTTVPS